MVNKVIEKEDKVANGKKKKGYLRKLLFVGAVGGGVLLNILSKRRNKNFGGGASSGKCGASR